MYSFQKQYFKKAQHSQIALETGNEMYKDIKK